MSNRIDFCINDSKSALPQYVVEVSKSARAKCVYCKQHVVNSTETTFHDAKIETNDIRIGCISKPRSKKQDWIHLKCFRVPRNVWKDLTDPYNYQLSCAELRSNNALFQGFENLNRQQMTLVVNHITNMSNWENKQYSKETQFVTKYVDGDNKENISNAATTNVSFSDKYRLKEKYRFLVPKPGSRGSKVDCLKKKIFVLNGFFPEVGGGTGSSLGKVKLKSIIESFGGTVTSTLTSNTSCMVMGRERKFFEFGLCWLFIGLCLLVQNLIYST